LTGRLANWVPENCEILDACESISRFENTYHEHNKKRQPHVQDNHHEDLWFCVKVQAPYRLIDLSSDYVR
jgi:hypothetical protein